MNHMYFPRSEPTTEFLATAIESVRHRVRRMRLSCSAKIRIRPDISFDSSVKTQ